MVEEMHDREGRIHHDAFQAWRQRNPDGMFLTMETAAKANLHGSQCQHLGATDWSYDANNRHSLTKKRKILGGAKGSLNSWAKRNSVEVHLCYHCVRDGFISESFFEESKPEATSPHEAMEGFTHEATVLSRGRSGALRKAALANAKGTCEACDVVFSNLLGGLGARVLHVHHRYQLALRDVPSVTRLADLAVVCANCHALIHSDPMRALPVEQLRALLASEPHDAQAVAPEGRSAGKPATRP